MADHILSKIIDVNNETWDIMSKGLETAVNIGVTGDVSGSVSTDLTGDAIVTATISDDAITADKVKDGETLPVSITGTADRAANDADGNDIADTYATKAENGAVSDRVTALEGKTSLSDFTDDITVDTYSSSSEAPISGVGVAAAFNNSNQGVGFVGTGTFPGSNHGFVCSLSFNSNESHALIEVLVKSTYSKYPFKYLIQVRKTKDSDTAAGAITVTGIANSPVPSSAYIKYLKVLNEDSTTDGVIKIGVGGDGYYSNYQVWAKIAYNTSAKLVTSTSISSEASYAEFVKTLNTANGTAVGSASIPTYVTSEGVVTACTDDFVHDGDVVSTYSEAGTAPVNGTAVADALNGLHIYNGQFKAIKIRYKNTASGADDNIFVIHEGFGGAFVRTHLIGFRMIAATDENPVENRSWNEVISSNSPVDDWRCRFKCYYVADAEDSEYTNFYLIMYRSTGYAVPVAKCSWILSPGAAGDWSIEFLDTTPTITDMTEWIPASRLVSATSTADTRIGSSSLPVYVNDRNQITACGSSLAVSVTGNAATATKATQDASGNVITTTYATKTEVDNKTFIKGTLLDNTDDLDSVYGNQGYVERYYWSSVSVPANIPSDWANDTCVMDVIRKHGTSNYVLQTVHRATETLYAYVRQCNNGTWGAWSKSYYTATNSYSATGTQQVNGTAVAAALATLDGSVTGTPGAGKTLTAFSETDGKVSATFGDISVTKSQVSDFSHAHGYLSNDGALTNSDTSIQSGSVLAVSEPDTETSSGKLAKTSIAFDGSTTTTALTPKGTWEAFLQSGDIAGKADKVSGATAGDIATLDADGNLADAGYKPSDYVPVRSWSLEAQKTTILALVQGLVTGGIKYRRYDTTSDGGSSGISDKPTGSTNKGFELECFQVRSCSSTDWEYQLVCRCHGDLNPYVALVTSSTTAISWSRANTNTDTKVTQTLVSDDGSYPLLLTPKGQTATSTTTATFDSGVSLNPSTNTITANISGNAGSAYAVGNGNDASSNTFDSTKTVQLITGAMTINATSLKSGRSYMIINSNGTNTDATIQINNDYTDQSVYRRLNGGSTTIASGASDNTLTIKAGCSMFIHVLGTTYVIHRTPIIDGSGYLTGNITGNAVTATTATNVSVVAGTTDTNRRVWFSRDGYDTQRAYDDDFKYNPATNVLTVENVAGTADYAKDVKGTVVTDANAAIPSLASDDSTNTNYTRSEQFALTTSASNIPNANYNWHVISVLYKLDASKYRVAQLAFGSNSSNGTSLFSRSGTSTDGSAWTFGSWLDANIDTKNTAGSTDTTSKIFLIGATSQATSPQTYSDSEVYVQNGTLYLSKNTDAAGTANNKPALIIGGTDTTAHIEIDPNEIMAKTNGTSVAPLYLNNEGGSVYVNGKLVARDAASKGSSSVPVYTNANGDIVACTDDFVHDGDVVSTYSSTGTAPVNGTAVAAAIQAKDTEYHSVTGATGGKVFLKIDCGTDGNCYNTSVVINVENGKDGRTALINSTPRIVSKADFSGNIHCLSASKSCPYSCIYWLDSTDSHYYIGYAVTYEGSTGYSYSATGSYATAISPADIELSSITVLGTGTTYRDVAIQNYTQVGSSGTPVYISATGLPTACTTADIQAGKDGAGNTITSTYLPLAGGTMTGNISYYGSTSKKTYSMIRFRDGTDTYGHGISIGGGGSTIIGAGESASNAESTYAANTETLVLSADNGIDIRTNMNSGISSSKLSQFNADGTLTLAASGSVASDNTKAVTGGTVYNAIAALDVTDTAVENKFVTAVSEADGKISVSRASLTATNVAQAGTLSNDTTGNASSSSYAKRISSGGINSALYVTDDTHYMYLGYLSCNASFQSATLLISSGFWGNLHGSDDIITIQQDTNTNGDPAVHCTLGRVMLGGSYERKFFYLAEGSTKLHLYVYVTGGNSYGTWQTSVLGGNMTWTVVGTKNVTKEDTWTQIDYTGKILSAKRLYTEPLTSSDDLNTVASPTEIGARLYCWYYGGCPAHAPTDQLAVMSYRLLGSSTREQVVYKKITDSANPYYYYRNSTDDGTTWSDWTTVYYKATSTYSATGKQAVNGVAVASAISGKANSADVYTKTEVDSKSWLSGALLTSSDDLDSNAFWINGKPGGINTYYFKGASQPAGLPSDYPTTVGGGIVVHYGSDTSQREIELFQNNTNDYYFAKRETKGTTVSWNTVYFVATSAYSSTGTQPVNGTAVAAAIGTLDVSAITGSTTKTITSISETDGKISATYSDIATMGAASSSAAGSKGLVPAPAAGDQAKFLRGDGTWVVPTNTDTLVLQSASTTENYRPIVLGYQNDTNHTTLSNTVTQQVYATNTMYAQPSTGMIAATSFKVGEAATFQYNSTDNSIDLVW